VSVFVRDQRFGPVGSLGVSRLGFPVDGCPPLVFVCVAGPGCRGSFVVQGRARVGLGCPAECLGAGGDRLACGSLRGAQVAPSRFGPLAGCGLALIVVLLCLQLDQARTDGAQALPDFLPASVPGLGFVGHASSMRAFGGFVAVWMWPLCCAWLLPERMNSPEPGSEYGSERS
jgi:hypothetical protein